MRKFFPNIKMISGERGAMFQFPNENQASLRGVNGERALRVSPRYRSEMRPLAYRRLHFAESMGKGALIVSLSLPLGNAPFSHCSDYVEPETYVLFDGKQVRKSNEAPKDRHTIFNSD